MVLKTHRWLRDNWKPALTHTSILSAFLLYCLFLSGPLFDRFESIEGESRMQHIELPAETDNVQYCLNGVRIGSLVTTVLGWAFVDGQGTENTQTYIILESDEECYVFDTMTALRHDVTSAYGAIDLNLDRSGFICNIPSIKISTGEYVVGIYIKTDNTEAFRRTDTHLVKSGGVLELVT